MPTDTIRDKSSYLRLVSPGGAGLEVELGWVRGKFEIWLAISFFPRIWATANAAAPALPASAWRLVINVSKTSMLRSKLSVSKKLTPEQPIVVLIELLGCNLHCTNLLNLLPELLTL